MASSCVCRARPRGRTGGRFRFQPGKPARCPDGRAGPGPCGPHVPSCWYSRLQDGGWSFGGLRLPLDSPFSPLGNPPLTNGVASHTPSLRLTGGALALCRKHMPRKHRRVTFPPRNPLSPSRRVTRFSPRTQMCPTSLLLVLRLCRSAGFGDGPSVQGCGHSSPENQGLATGYPFLQLPVPRLSALPGACPSRSLANNRVCLRGGAVCS